MSWPAWSAPGAALPPAMAAPVQSTLLPAGVNSAPSVVPPGLQYSPEQWAQAQQQNWQQWAQWQQQYQQWHQQYGAEYQKSMSAMQNTMPMQPQAQPPLPTMPNTGVPPPLPADNKPPLPPEDPPTNQPTGIAPYGTMPSKPVQQPGYSTVAPTMLQQPGPLGVNQPNEPFPGQRQNWQSSQTNVNNKRPYGQQAEYDNAKRPMTDRQNQWGQNQKQNQWQQQQQQQQQQHANFHPQAPPQAQSKAAHNIEELSEAEKKFDKEFAAWEAQFNKWKEQNANHPDKTQYLEYEKKWESWRNSLLERREQMRRKRLAMVAAAGGNKPSFAQQAAQPPQQAAPDMSRAPPHMAQPQPHPHLQVAPQGRPGLIAPQLPKASPNDSLISKPPPNQNNEPLAFKPPGSTIAPFPTEEVPEISGDGFLKSSDTSGGIPGLDLVKEDEQGDTNKDNVIDLENEDKSKQEKPDVPPLPKGPDLDAISKGINTILGDQKLLSMLSMVSQNPPTAPPPNVAVDTISTMNPTVAPNFNAPPPPHQFGDGNYSVPPPGNYGYNDQQSNHSLEERPVHGENFPLRESVNNFDDQTRSSFTMGPNDQDPYQGNNYARNQNKFGPSRFGPEPNRNNFGPGPNFASNPPDNRNKFGPNVNRGGDFGPGGPRGGNFNPQEGGNFNQGDNFTRGNFNRGNHGDNFNGPDDYDNFNKGDNNFQRDNNFQKDKFDPNDGFNRAGNNFRGGFDRSNNNLGKNDNRPNFNRSDSFNQRQPFQDKYGSNRNYDQSNYDDYENYEDDDDFEKYHNMFNDDDESPQGPQKFGQHSRMMDQDMGPRSTNQGRQPGGRMGNQPLLPTPTDQGPGKRDNQGPQTRGLDQGPHGRGKDQRPPLMGKNQGGPPMRGMNQGPMRDFDQRAPGKDMDQGPPMRDVDRAPQMRGMDKGPLMRGMDQGPPMRGMDQGPPMRGVDQGPPMRGMDRGPPMRGMDQAPPMRGMGQVGQMGGMDQGPPMRGMNQMPSLMDMEVVPPMRGMGQGPLMEEMDQGPPPPLISEPIIEPLVPLETEEIFEPVTVIDYEHKSQRTPEPEVAIEPLHMFDYRHKPLNRIPVPQRPAWLSELVKFIREFDPQLVRPAVSFERPPPPDRYPANKHRPNWEPDVHEDRHRSRGGRDHNDRNGRFSDDFDRMERRPFNRDESRFVRQDVDDRGRHSFNDDNNRSGNRRGSERGSRFESPPRSKNDFEEFSDDDMNDFESGETRKRTERGRLERSKSRSRSPILSNPPNPAQVREITMMEDILNPPGRFNRPPRIVIILRGPPGSGKTYLAKIIKDKEVENGGSPPRILSLDDYFMVEHEKEVIEDGKMVKVKEMVYEYEAEMEDSYRASFIKFFKKTITDGYFPFIIVDNVNDKVKYFGEMWSYAKQNGFQVYICQMDLDPVLCSKRNIHNRSEAEIEECIAGWEPTPAHHPTIEATGLLQSSAISEVEMEEVEPQREEPAKPNEGPEDEVRSKWDTFDCSSNNLAKLDGVSKPLRPSRTMEEYLQLEDNWETKPTKPGQKRVRWADLEEQREQKKMRAIGFVVGHTNWDRMMDPTDGGSALTQTKYFDRNFY